MENESSYIFQYKILLLGETSTGKQDLLDKYIVNPFHFNLISTIGVDIRYKNIK